MPTLPDDGDPHLIEADAPELTPRRWRPGLALWRFLARVVFLEYPKPKRGAEAPGR